MWIVGGIAVFGASQWEGWCEVVKRCIPKSTMVVAGAESILAVSFAACAGGLSRGHVHVHVHVHFLVSRG